MTIPKWDEARTEELTKFIGDVEPVTIDTVAEAADRLGTSARSVSAKLRKLGYEVEKASSVASKTFSEKEEEALKAFLTKNPSQYTFTEIAGLFADGRFNSRQIQGKILSMELTDLVKPAEKKEYQRTFSEKEEATFVKMAKEDAFLEDIAAKLNRTVPAIRGKALSLLRAGQIEAIPATKNVAKVEDPFEGLKISEMTVEEISEKTDRTVRGVKTMLTRRKLVAKDYDGAAKAEKAAKAAAAA